MKYQRLYLLFTYRKLGAERNTMSRKVAQFFQEFQQASKDFDAERSGRQFAEVFLHSDPETVQAVKREDFIKALPLRKAFFGKLGLQQTTMQIIQEVDMGAHILVRATVDMTFEKNGTPVRIHQTASYILKENGESYVIIAYINDQLLQALLAEHGLTPA